jgi:hypothetical protein
MNRLTSDVSLLVALLPIVILSGFVILNLMMLRWIYRDARARGVSGILWAIIALVGGLIGVMLWMSVRPPKQDAQTLSFIPNIPDNFYDLDDFSDLDNTPKTKQ